MADNDDGSRLRQVTDIAANHREIHFACRKRIGRFKHCAAVDNLEPYRRVRRYELARDCRHGLGSFAVDRTHRHAQRCRARIVPIGKKACAGRKANDSDKQHKTKPERQIWRHHARYS
jgi:hypothetical protein